jgi:hypothetical protein
MPTASIRSARERSEPEWGPRFHEKAAPVKSNARHHASIRTVDELCRRARCTMGSDAPRCCHLPIDLAEAYGQAGRAGARSHQDEALKR